MILLHEINTDVQVYDFDTTLNFPCSLKDYVMNALQNEQNFKAYFHRLVQFYFTEHTPSLMCLNFEGNLCTCLNYDCHNSSSTSLNSTFV